MMTMVVIFVLVLSKCSQSAYTHTLHHVVLLVVTCIGTAASNETDYQW